VNAQKNKQRKPVEENRKKGRERRSSKIGQWDQSESDLGQVEEPKDLKIKGAGMGKRM